MRGVLSNSRLRSDLRFSKSESVAADISSMNKLMIRDATIPLLRALMFGLKSFLLGERCNDLYVLNVPFLISQISFAKLKNLDSQLVDCIRRTNSSSIILNYKGSRSLQEIQSDSTISITQIRNWTIQIIRNLLLLENNGIIHGNLSKETVYITPNNNLIFRRQFLFYWANYEIPIGKLKCIPPETILNGQVSSKFDVWSLGMLLAELAIGSDFYGSQDDLLSQILKSKDDHELEFLGIIKDSSIDQDLKVFIQSCLEYLPQDRPSLTDLLDYDFLGNTSKTQETQPIWPIMAHSHDNSLTVKDILHLYLVQNSGCDDKGIPEDSPFINLPLYIKLSDDLNSIMEKCKKRIQLPISQIEYALNTSGLQDISSDSTIKYDETWKHTGQWDYDNINKSIQLFKSRKSISFNWSAKEKNVSYQRKRTVLFRNLIAKYPLSLDTLISECIVDVPRNMRAAIYGALLGANGDTSIIFDILDCDLPLPIDQQIQKDIRRCHQYDHILSSAEGQDKLGRIIKAWAVFNSENLVYWQGLDSIAAPFVSLMYENEGLAFACLNGFVLKYCKGFFLADNSDIIDRHMHSFKRVFAFNDLKLLLYLEEIGLYPRIFALSWFLTCFSHVLPISHIYRVWDELLTRSPYMTIFVALSILYQYRDLLLSQDFNQNMVLLSSLKSLNIEQCLIDAILFYKITPPSIYEFNQKNRLKSWIAYISATDFLEMRHYSLVVDMRNHFSQDHLIGAIKAPKHFSDLISIRDKLSKSFIVFAYSNEAPEKKIEKILRSHFPNGVCLFSIDEMEGIDSCFCSNQNRSSRTCISLEL